MVQRSFFLLKVNGEPWPWNLWVAGAASFGRGIHCKGAENKTLTARIFEYYSSYVECKYKKFEIENQ